MQEGSSGNPEADSRAHNSLAIAAKANRVAWINSVLPISIALGPVSTIIQLFILNMHGTVIEVSLAITLYNTVSIPAAMFWGFATDRARKRRPIIIVSYLATAGIFVLFFAARTFYSVSLLYALFSFATTASTTPLNLLIMETERKQKWASAFARLSMISSIGNTIGLVLCLGWSFVFSLTYIVLALAILSLISAGLSVLMISEPKVIFERNMIALTKPSFFHRLKVIPYLFLRIPGLNDFRRVFKALECEVTRHVPLLYLSIFAFYLGTGIFNTSIVPSLHANHASNLVIFLATTIAMVVQVVSFRFAGPYTEKKSPAKAAVASLILRSACYGLLGVSVYLVAGIWFLAPVLILYPLAAGLAYSIYYTASNTMVFNTLGQTNQGSSLGVYSALVAIATMIGSLISGFSSFYLGFYTTFILAATCLAVSAWLVSTSAFTQSGQTHC
ncbi:MAG TPA: MFS transporter [Candidatus Acidoferrum sp.]|nr:MFS transporter [Candidatus Acidoferrum sp.]